MWSTGEVSGSVSGEVQYYNWGRMRRGCQERVPELAPKKSLPFQGQPCTALPGHGRQTEQHHIKQCIGSAGAGSRVSRMMFHSSLAPGEPCQTRYNIAPHIYVWGGGGHTPGLATGLQQQYPVLLPFPVYGGWLPVGPFLPPLWGKV